MKGRWCFLSKASYSGQPPNAVNLKEAAATANDCLILAEIMNLKYAKDAALWVVQ